MALENEILMTWGTGIFIAISACAGLYSAFSNKSITLQKHHHEKKSRLLDVCRGLPKHYPRTHEDRVALKNALYDFSNKKTTDYRLLSLILNSKHSPILIENLAVAGDAVNYCRKQKTIQKKDTKLKDNALILAALIYYIAAAIMAWAVIAMLLPNAKIDNLKSLVAYTALILFSFGIAWHGFTTMVNTGNRAHAIKNLMRFANGLPPK